MQELNNSKFLTTSELAVRTGKSPRTLVRYANRGCPGAYWSNYSHAWEWDIAEYEQGIRTHKTRPKPEPHAGTRRGRKPRGLSVVK